MANHADVLILGGGVIGLTTAYFLARERARVTVLDKGDFGQEASWAGAGILPPAQTSEVSKTSEVCSGIDQLRGHSAVLFPSLSEELRQLTGIDNGYLRCGGLEFLSGPKEAEEEWHAQGMTLQTLDEPALARLEPNLARGLGLANYLPDMAQLRNPRHLKALLAACKSRGVTLRPGCAVHGFVSDGPRIQAVKTLDDNLPAERFLLASGAWTGPLTESLGCSIPIKPVRGQIALLNTSTPVFRRILLWGSRYLVPRPDGKVLVGSTEEHAGFDKRTTSQAIADLLQLANRLVPDLGSAHLERCWAGLRPGSPDGLPFLGPIPGWDNLFVAAGHFRAGIQLSPGTALVMKECLLGRPPSFAIDGFSLERSLHV
jgi:glycine oxidase